MLPHIDHEKKIHVIGDYDVVTPEERYTITMRSRTLNAAKNLRRNRRYYGIHAGVNGREPGVDHPDWMYGYRIGERYNETGENRAIVERAERYVAARQALKAKASLPIVPHAAA